jgi:hypothetical protein
MANQHTTPQTTKLIVRAILIAVALIILVLSLDQSATQLSNYFGTAAKDTIELLPSLLLTAWQASQPSAHHEFSLCAAQMLISWPLLQTAAKVAVA